MTAAVSIPSGTTAGTIPATDAVVGHATHRGPRRHQADAVASHRTRWGRLAVAVADGVGDSEDAAFAARLVADHAVRVATLEGRPDIALLAAHDVLDATRDLVSGDAAAVVALAPGPGEPRWRLAWVGDCRALAFNGRTLRTLTSDHTAAAHMRSLGLHPHPSLEHVITTSARTVRPQKVGIAVVDDPGTLLLVSDGVHRAVSVPSMAALLAAGGGVEERAARIVRLAESTGLTDNATALVVAG